MIEVQQGNTTVAIPFPVLLNSGNYAGDPNATPTVELSKNGGDLVPAYGQVKSIGKGLFCLLPDPRDADTLGPVQMVLSVGGSDIGSWPGFVVKQRSWWQDLFAIPQNIAASAANSRLVAKATIPPNQQGLIQ